jgi:heme exporter protein CcmD
MDLGPYAAFIIAAYAVAFVIVAGMIAWVWTDHRRQKKILSDLESRGVSRRSDRIREAKQ